MMKRTRLLLAFLTAACVSSHAGVTSVPVGDILPESLLKSDLYTLAPEARVVDSIATFIVNSAHGSHEVTGRVGLEEHIVEIEAIAKLEEMKKTGVFKDAAKNSALGPWNTAKGLVTEPITTVKESAKGFGGFIADIGYSITSKDPNQENAGKTALGFPTAKRQLAYELGVNPYSRFEPLQDTLGEVAWTATGGGLAVTVLFSFVKDTPGTVLRVSKAAGASRKLVRDLSPRKLAKHNEEVLAAMGIDENSIEFLLENFNFDPETRTRLVTALDGLQPAEGLQNLVDIAVVSRSPQQAQVIRDWVELMEAFSQVVTPAGTIAFYDSTPFVVDADGNIYGVFPTDYATADASTTEELAAITKLITADGFTPAKIYATGKVDSGLKAALLDAGWKKVHQGAEEKLRVE